MGGLSLGALVGAVLTLVGTLVGAFVMLPKIRAEARKLGAEAERIEWQTLRDEIDRQTNQIKELREEIHALRNAVTTREAELERENKTLRAKVQRLTVRVEGLEAILKVTPIPPELQALLDELDQKTK